MPRSAATCSIASRSGFQSRGALTSRPRISRRRSTICSMSITSTPNWARVSKTSEVTPGRSLPVRVISRVRGCSRRSPPARAEVSRAGRRLSPRAEQAPTRARRAARSRSPRAARRCSISYADTAPPSSARASSTMSRQSTARSAVSTGGRRTRAGGAAAAGAAGSSAGRGCRAATRRRRGRPAAGSRRRAPRAAPTAVSRSSTHGARSAGWARHTTVRASTSGTRPTPRRRRPRRRRARQR